MNKNLVLAAMVFAVAMTFIDQTIVAIAVPTCRRTWDLSEAGSQWVINGYLLSLSALFAFGESWATSSGAVDGRRRRGPVRAGVRVLRPDADGQHRRTVADLLPRPAGRAAAIMFPPAVGIVVASFPVHERGKAMAIFFGVAGGLTAIGPIAGGYLTQWTWRAIFWVNIPVAIIALILIWRSKPENEKRPTKLDYRGHRADLGGDGADRAGIAAVQSVGLEQPGDVGLHNRRPAAEPCSCAASWSIDEPLLRLQIFKDRGFSVDNVVLGLMSSCSSRSSSSPASTRRVAGRELLEGRALPSLLLPRVRRDGADRRAHPRPPRSRPAVVSGSASPPWASTCSRAR